MAIITKQLLKNIDINLDDKEYELLAEHLDTTLEERVINELAEILTNEQAQELRGLDDANEAEYQQWLDENIPEFSDIVADEVDILLGEIAENNESLNA